MFAKILYRPALAIVISILLLFLGGLGIKTLPQEQFPSVAPPVVLVFVTYPGATAETLVKSTVIPLERSINGVQNMRYMTSQASSAGEAAIYVYFEPGTNANENAMLVLNRVNAVRSRLPDLVVREGIMVRPIMTSMLMYVNIYSTNKDADQTFLYNFTKVNVLPEIKRSRGVARARLLGTRNYAIKVWLNPDRMRAYKVSTEEVMEAMETQSVIPAVGRLGRATGAVSQSKEYVLKYQGRFNKPEQYANIIVRANPDGEVLRLGDIGRVELDAELYDIYSDVDNNPAASIILKQTPGSNAVEVIEEVKKKLEEIKKESFPPGMDYEVAYDVSKFLDASIEQVLHTLLEAFILVSLVVYLFLGDVRSTLIPVLAVPVSLVGAFFLMQLFGLSINLITLFAMVLAIGIVVDDAIVVVEAMHAKMAEHHLSPYRAAMEVLHEISGAIIAITLVMTAVFIPITFVPGPVGKFYREFGITMASSIVLSGVVALTLTPVLCAMILKPHSHGESHPTHGKTRRRLRTLLMLVFVGLPILAGVTYLAYSLWGPVGFLFILLPFVQRPFSRAVDWITNGYAWLLRPIVMRRALTLLVITGFSVGIYVVNMRLPTGFIPNEDQGIIYAVLQTPPGSTLEYTNHKVNELQDVCKKIDEVQSVTAMAGYEIMTQGRGSNSGTCLIRLKSWEDRERTVKEIIEALEEKKQGIAGAKVEFFGPPAVPGFGFVGGISLRLLDKHPDTDYKRLGEVNEKFMAALSKRKELQGLFTFYSANYPQYELIIDNKAAMQKGVPIGKALETLKIYVGSTFEQAFIRFGFYWRVYVQAGPEFRRYPTDLENLFVKNDKGKMVPFSAFMKWKKTQGLNEIMRYNVYNAANINCAPAPGYSTGQAIAAIKEVADETLPARFDLGWQGLSYDQARAGNESVYIFLIVVAFVYLVLVGQYESFLLPLAVIVSLPIGVFGSFLFLSSVGLANNVYCQIGLIMLVGLLGKNAILIVEFAVQRRREGLSLKEAAIEGAKVRFRPILMTSFAFTAGLIPLVVATGAGSIGNRTIGTTGAGGMLMGTVIGVLVIPGLYYIFAKQADGKKLLRDEVDEPLSEKFERESLPPDDAEKGED